MIDQIGSLLTSISTATELARLIRSSTNSLEKAGMNNELADLIVALAEAKISISDIKQTLAEKNDEIEKLKQAMKIEAQMEYETPYYWRVINEKKNGPFCQACFDKDRALIRLQPSGNGHWSCRVCKQFFTDSNYVERTIRYNDNSDWPD